MQVSSSIIGTESGSASCSAVHGPAVLHLFGLVQRVMELEADAMGHELLFVDEAGFNLTKTRRCGRNLIGHCAIINVPGQRGGNITM